MSTTYLYDESAALFGKEAILAYQEKRTPDFDLKKLRQKFKFIAPPPQPPPTSPSSPSKILPPLLRIQTPCIAPISQIMPREINQRRQMAAETRIDPMDGYEYTQANFIAHYGGLRQWNAAKRGTAPFIIDIKPISPTKNYSQNLYGSSYDITDPLTNNRCNCYIL